MKKIPSIANIELKNNAWEMGEVPKAFDKWFTFAPRESHW